MVFTTQCYSTITISGSNRIKEIKSNFQRVLFNYATPRQDIEGGTANPSYALSSCEFQVLTPSNSYKSIKKINLTHEYFVSSTLPPIQEEGKRLKLKSVQEIGIDINNAEMPLPPHVFTYLEEGDYNLPPRLSFKQDHWGFANDNQASTLIPKDATIPALVNGANRNTHSEKVKSGIIRRITYPTGGYSEFDFEANAAYLPNNTLFYDEEVPHTATSSVRHFTGESGLKVQIADFTITGSNPQANIPIMVNWITYNSQFYGDGGQTVAIYRKSTNARVWETSGTTRGQSQSIFLTPDDYQVYAEVNLANDIASINVVWKTFERLSAQQNMDPGNATVGGVRIKQINNYVSNTAQPIVKKIEYISDPTTLKTSGELTSTPKYDFPHNTFVQVWRETNSPSTPAFRVFALNLDLSTVEFYVTPINLPSSIVRSNIPPIGILENEYTCSFRGYSSTSKVPLGSTQGNHVYYTKVTVYNDATGDGAGKSEMFYSKKDDALNFAYPYIKHDSYDWQRGLLEKQIDYKKTSNGYVEIKKVTNVYKLDRLNPNISSSLNNYTKNGYAVVYYPANPTTRLNNTNNQVKINSHRIMSPWLSLAQTTVVQDGIETVTNYTYDEANGTHTQAIVTSTTSSKNELIKTETSYQWLERHILAANETRTYNNTQLIGGSKTEYKPFATAGGVVSLPFKWSSIFKNNTIKIKLLYQTTATTPMVFCLKSEKQVIQLTKFTHGKMLY